MNKSASYGALSLRLVAVFVLVLLNGFFVATEYALVSARRSRLDQIAEAGSIRARVARRLQENLDRTIAATQLGVTICSLLLGALAEPTFSALIEPPVAAATRSIFGFFHGMEVLAETISHALGVGVSLFIVTTLHIVLGEQSPKVLAIRAPERVAMFGSQPFRWFNIIFSPVIAFLDWLTGVTLAAVGVRGSSEHHGPPTLEELRLMVQSSAAGGVIERDEQEMLINVFDFGSRAAYQVMVPRTEAATINESATVREFLELFRTTGHTRFPVLGERGIDDVRGIISAKDLLVALSERTIDFEETIASLVRPAYFAPDSKRVSDLLHAMQREHVRMSVLVDEYGGMAGIATLEDLVEEIVGELDDELDTGQTEIETVDEHTLIVEGVTRIDDANDDLKLQLPRGEYETIAGLILNRLGRLPNPGEQIQIDAQVLTVLDVQGPRIARVQIVRR